MQTYYNQKSAKDMTVDELVEGFKGVSRQAVHSRVKKFRDRGDEDTATKIERAYAIFKNLEYKDSGRVFGKVCGVGDSFSEVYSPKSHPKLYNLWNGIMERCSWSSKRKNLSSYLQCKVSDKFKSFDYFCRWSELQYGYSSGFSLDKDLLSIGGKVYSENTCVFIPQEINIIIAKTGSSKNSGMPTGVNINKTGTIYARCRVDKKYKHLGSFNCIEDAANAYKIAKKKEIVKLAEKWKDQIDPRAYQALLDYEI